MQHKMNDAEYASLRNEIIMRIQLINTQENTAILMSVGFFAAAFAVGFIESNNAVYISLIALYVPLFVLMPVANKSGENIYQIMVLSSYIRVFYEYPAIASKPGEKELFSWESAFQAVSRMHSTRDPRGRNRQNTITGIDEFFNASYWIIAIVSLVLFLIKAVFFIVKQSSVIQICSIIIVLLLVFVGLFIIHHIYHLSSVKDNAKKPRAFVVETFVKRAQRMGVIEDGNLEAVVKEICDGIPDCSPPIDSTYI